MGALPVVGQGIEAAKGIFGSAQSQNSTGHQQTVFRPGDETALRSQVGNVQNQARAFSQLLANLQQQAAGPLPQLQQNAGLNTNFVKPEFSNQLDALSKALVSQGQQANQAQLQGQQQQIARQFSNNPVLAKILGNQAAAGGQLANNPLQFQAMQGQDQRTAGRADAQNQAISLVNNALLQGANFANQAMLGQYGLGQQQRAEQAGYGGQQLQVQQGLAALLQELGKQFATTHMQQNSRGRSGGLF